MFNVLIVGMVLFHVVIVNVVAEDTTAALFPFSLARGRNGLKETSSVMTIDDQKIVPEFHHKEGVALAATQCTTATSCTTTGKVKSGWVYMDMFGIQQGNSYGPLNGPLSGFGCPASMLIDRMGQPLGVCLPKNNNGNNQPITYYVLSANITTNGAVVGIFQDNYGTSSTCNTAAISNYNRPSSGTYLDYHGNFNTSSCFLRSSPQYASVRYSTSPPPDPALTNPSAVYGHDIFYSDAACASPIFYDHTISYYTPPAGTPSAGCFLALCGPNNGKCKK